ncbi:MAG: hypothetical protein PHU51_06180, partial [Candidatus Nanoarchaeia archaeon]|nr:hypothetical protein [Candidatus Nanoarchaeia archaeon]
MVLIAKYYNYLGYDVKQSLRKYIDSRNVNYNQVIYDKYISLAYNNSLINLLRTNISISLTKKEVDCLLTIEDVTIQKIMFVILVVVKYYFMNPSYVDAKLEDRMNKDVYLNNSLSDIFKVAKVSYNRKKRKDIMVWLIKNKYIIFTDRYKYIVPIVDLEGESFITFDLEDNFILVLDKIKGEKVIQCEKCKKYIKINNKKMTMLKYCRECSHQANIEKYALYNKKRNP